MEKFPPGIIGIERVYEPDLEAQVKALKILLEHDRRKTDRDRKGGENIGDQNTRRTG